MSKAVSSRDICFIKAVQTRALLTNFFFVWTILSPPIKKTIGVKYRNSFAVIKVYPERQNVILATNQT